MHNPRKVILWTLILLVLFSYGVLFAQEASESGADAEYRLSVNDLIDITVYQEPDLSKTLRVSGDGTISFPLLGAVYVKGLTAKDVETKLGELLMADYLVNPQVSVFIKEYSKYIILGQVRTPGSFQLKSDLKIMDAIALAGGFTDTANPEDVKLTREIEGKKVTVNIDANNITSEEGQDQNVVLQPNDLIVVGKLAAGEEVSTDYIIVLGKVRSPGRYPYKKGMTVVEAIAAAGGLADTAAGNSTKVIREADGKRSTFSVPVASILSGRSIDRDVVLEPEDKVVVPESFF